MKLVRAGAFLIIALMGILVVRDAVVRSRLPDNPHEAALAWPSHPAAVIADGMSRIGRAANLRRPVDDTLTGPIIEAARRAPLAIEPFLVAGVKQQTLGNEALAGELFLAAEQRDPRAVAPKLFLSVHYSKMGNQALSLAELGEVLSLVPGSVSELGPKIAESIDKAGGLPAVRALVTRNEGLRESIMRALATDARNYDVVMSLRTPGSTGDWEPIMIRSLVVVGRYAPALDLWSKANRTKVDEERYPLLFDEDFRLGLSAPFGWTLYDGASSAGFVEPAETSGLHVISYGRDQFIPATQTLLLAAGAYEVSQVVRSVTGNISALSWRLMCDGISRELGVASFANGEARGRFEVSSDCHAQQLQLVAASTDVPETLEVTLGPIKLKRR